MQKKIVYYFLQLQLSEDQKTKTIFYHGWWDHHGNIILESPQTPAKNQRDQTGWRKKNSTGNIFNGNRDTKGIHHLIEQWNSKTAKNEWTNE